MVLDGTYARAARTRRHEDAAPRRSIPLSDCDPEQVFFDSHAIGALQPSHYAQNSELELRLLLRSLNVTTTGKKGHAKLAKTLRFHVGCDDTLFDSAPMPARLQIYQIWQAIIHVLAYYYGPMTRALVQFFLCREVAGSGDPADPDPAYHSSAGYLKSDMQYACGGGEHLPVAIAAGIIWLCYAVAYPLFLAVMIRKHKRAHDAAQADGTIQAADFWSSPKPVVEKFWLPIVAHLQVRTVCHTCATCAQWWPTH